jgi:hypothetical protein
VLEYGRAVLMVEVFAQLLAGLGTPGSAGGYLLFLSYTAKLEQSVVYPRYRFANSPMRLK